MDHSCSIETLIKEFSNAVIFKKASIFIGSGLSRPADYVGWKDILRECAQEIGLDVDKEERNLITLAEYYVKRNQRTKINEAIREFFADNKGEPTDNHTIITTFPITSIWTTNYDTLIERAYKTANIPYNVLTDDNSYKEANRGAKITIHKIHGDVNSSDKCVITRKDYEEFPESHDIILSELKGEMCSNSFLFLGYGFNDTDVQHILSKIRFIYRNSHPQKHYCVVERVSKEKCKDEEEYNYECNRQNHHVSDMQSYGINVTLVDSYSQITDILKRIKQRVLLKHVSICGSYEDNFQHAKLSAECVQKIASELIKQDFKIFTGYGKNLGNEIVAGAFDGCTKVKKDVKEFNDNVFLFPFPFRQRDDNARKKLYTQLRQNMISKTQITIVIAGQKANGIADGVLEEVEIARRHGNLIIPLATTGGVAESTWKEMSEDGSEYTQTDTFKALGDTTPNEMWNRVNEIISNYIDSLS